MARLISFRTSRFDVRAETPNPINLLAGQSVLNWLRDELAKAGYQTTEPDCEDWGWYMDVEGDGGSYLVGASADAPEAAADVEWGVQISKHRSVMDKLRGRNEMTAGDPLAALIERIIRGDDQIVDIAVEPSE